MKKNKNIIPTVTDEETENWKLLTVSRGGTISLIQGLSLKTAKRLAENLIYDPTKAIQLRELDGDIIQTYVFNK